MILSKVGVKSGNLRATGHLIKIDWKRFILEHVVTTRVLGFVYRRQWFGWWWATYCSAHQFHNDTCHLCRAGNWARGKYHRWTIKKFGDPGTGHPGPTK